MEMRVDAEHREFERIVRAQSSREGGRRMAFAKTGYAYQRGLAARDAERIAANVASG
jgi:hypothetical protein